MGTYAVLAAAGGSSRMQLQSAQPSKVLLPLGPLGSVLAYSVRALHASGVLDGLVIAGRQSDLSLLADECRRIAPELKTIAVAGGATRQESIDNALAALEGNADYVLIHDAARPLCSPELVRAVHQSSADHGAAVPCIPVKSTLKHSAGRFVAATVPRADLWEAQTPQGFRFELIRQAHRRAKEQGYPVTDDSELVERLGHRVAVVAGEESNLKITTPVDLEFARFLLTRG